MRIATLTALVLLVGCGPGVDPLIGTYNLTYTATDTNTAPNTDKSDTTGTGTLTVTANAAMTGYVITAAHSNGNPCVIEGTAAEKATAPEITVKAATTCVFISGSTTTTVTMSSGKALLKLNDTRAMDVITLNVAYTYTGVTTFGALTFTFAGGGVRTYTGTRR